MAKDNFIFRNRCVYVSDKDGETCNVPPFAKCKRINNDRDYPSYAVKSFDYWEVIFTLGYYEGGCIDYMERSTPYDVLQGYIGYPDSQNELFKVCRAKFNLSEGMLRKICGKVGSTEINSYIADATKKIGKYLSQKEETEVNKYIDGLKKKYGYTELKRANITSENNVIYEVVK